MVKAVFDVKAGSGYDDNVECRYHFPGTSTYLAAAREAVGDWIIYREPQRNRGRRAYVAAAQVVAIEPDEDQAGYYYAHVAHYIEFADPVPFVVDGRYAEAPLRLINDPNRVGAAVQGKSIRPISSEDFDQIVLSGLGNSLAPHNAIFLGLDPQVTELALNQPFERRVETVLLNRKVREANFRLEVCRAYDNRCAVTGLRIINGSGQMEVQAAHIKPVAAGGPDIVQNGIALSATVHWLFDSHLVSIHEDYQLLVDHNRIPGELRRLFRPGPEGLYLPSDRRLWPRLAFLTHHREAYEAIP